MRAARSANRSISVRPAAARRGAARPSVRRAHLLEQEVTLAYLRELAGH